MSVRTIFNTSGTIFFFFYHIEITKKDNSHRFLPSPELLGCFVLGFFLVIAVITNILLCHHDKKKKGRSKHADQHI